MLNARPLKYDGIRFLVLFYLIFHISFITKASKIANGFKALVVFDYFKAKKLFYSSFKNKPNPYSTFGLSVIYSRNDNPFFNLDSASKYAALSYNLIAKKPERKQFFNYTIDSIASLRLIDSIASKGFEVIKKENSKQGYTHFLKQNYLANKNILNEVVYLRDELDYYDVLNFNNSLQTKEFIILHPQSSFVQQAQLLLERQLFDEQTKEGNALSYINFIKQYPKTVLLNSAYEKLFIIYKTESNISGLKLFVTNYPTAPQNLEAWKLLFALTVKSFSNEELEKFLVENPLFPLKKSILNELALNNLVLYQYQQDDFFGFIDTSSKLVIPAQFDAVTDFSEGLAVVTNNDSVFYINKENVNIFNQVYNDAYPFKNGIAPVKLGKLWCFINRQAQIISSFYDEINELSDNCYIIKLNDKFGVINNFGQTIIEPRFEELSDFKNDFAFYKLEGRSGFVSKDGYLHKADFDWLSDFDKNKIAIVKKGKAYGLINANGKVMLETKYDQIIRANNGVFILVLNNVYGFYNSNDCFLSEINYDFIKEKPSDFYTNGFALKLIKKNKQALMDLNGRNIIDYGVYDEINFMHNGLMRVKNKNKFGYIDGKFNLVIPLKYLQAADFIDSCAIVHLKNDVSLITIQGKEIFSTPNEIKKVSTHYYLINSEHPTLINNKGNILITEVANIQVASNNILIVTLTNQTIKLIKD